MILSLNWLKEYVDLPENISPEKLAHDITMSTVEVEEILDQAQQFEHMVLGVVTELKQHPNADRLQVAMTDIGSEIVQIICGGSNLSVGMRVAVALPGARVRWHGEGDLITLEVANVRGESSHGMICASEEIGLADFFPSKGEKDIIDLSAYDMHTAGTPLADVLGLNDILIDIDNKSLTNRPDLWSHYGMARELAAQYRVQLREPRIREVQATKFPITIHEEDQCFGYATLIVESNNAITPTPEYIQKRLQACGIRPISFFVDITNYVMLDIGEPMHAFDADKIKNGLHVRFAKKTESLTLLGGEKRELTENDLVIADEKEPLALAGIKGGETSGVTNTTSKVLFEAATFDAMTIRRSATKHGIRTESSQRHEKGLDTDKELLALYRVAQILSDHMHDVRIVGYVQVLPKPTISKTVSLSYDFITSRLGERLPTEEMQSILEKLGFGVVFKDNQFSISVPTWRSTGDVSIPEDIVEEIARMYGYDNLKRFNPQVTLSKAVLQSRQSRERHMREYLAYTAGCTEVFAYPWIDDSALVASGYDFETCLELACPPADDVRFLSPTLIPGLLRHAEHNIYHHKNFRLFQVARVFQKNTDSVFSQKNEHLPAQPKQLGMVFVGDTLENIFSDIKGVISAMGDTLGFSVQFTTEASSVPVFSNQQTTLTILAGDAVVIGSLGQIKKSTADYFIGEETCVVYAELNLDALASVESESVQYKPLPQYPSIERDIAIEIDRVVSWQTIHDTISHVSDLIQSITVFDIYTGSHVPSDKKSVAFRIVCNGRTRTLESSEVDEIVKSITTLLTTKLHARIRS